MYKQYVQLDNGLSHSQVPEKTFTQLMKKLSGYGFDCVEGKPIWKCQGEAKMPKLPDIEFHVVQHHTGATTVLKMPHGAYIKQLEKDSEFYELYLTPWQFTGLSDKDNTEYWVLGTPFLKNYYTIFNSKENIIGFVESKTSVIG